MSFLILSVSCLFYKITAIMSFLCLILWHITHGFSAIIQQLSGQLYWAVTGDTFVWGESIILMTEETVWVNNGYRKNIFSAFIWYLCHQCFMGVEWFIYLYDCLIIIIYSYIYYNVVKPSHLLDHTNPKCEETGYNVLYRYVLCTVLEYW